MLFVDNFCPHLKYCNITHDIPDLVSKYEHSKRLPDQSQQLEQSLKYVHS